jgi:hypothetical protein
MRKDLAKLTTESSRVGGYGKIKYSGRVRINHDSDHDYLDEFGGFRSSARHRQNSRYGGGHIDNKSFTDVLSPLIGAIRKNINRPWDDVYSEFCEVLDRRGVSGYHIWTHLMQEVVTKTELGIDGKVYEKPTRYSWRRGPVTGFYVHPVSGLLLYRPDDRRSRREPPMSDIKVPGENKQVYRKVDGNWFRVEVKKIKTWWPYNEEELIIKMKSANRKEIAWIKKQTGAQ